MITSITFLHHGIHWTLYFNIVYNNISILLNHLRTSSFAPECQLFNKQIDLCTTTKSCYFVHLRAMGYFHNAINHYPGHPHSMRSGDGTMVGVLFTHCSVVTYGGWVVGSCSCYEGFLRVLLFSSPPKKKKPTFQIQLELETVDQKNHFVVCSELHYNYHSHHCHYHPMIKFCQRKTNQLIFLEFWLFGEVDWCLFIPLTTFPLFLFLSLF